MNLMAIVLVGLFVLLALVSKRDERAMAAPAPVIICQRERQSNQESGLTDAIAVLVMVTVFSIWLLGAVGDKALNRVTSAASSASSASQPASEATPIFAAPNTIQL